MNLTPNQRSVILLFVVAAVIISTEAFQTSQITATSVSRNVPSCRFTSEHQTDSQAPSSSRSIVSLVENGNLDDALSMLQNSSGGGENIPASTYHSVLEAFLSQRLSVRQPIAHVQKWDRLTHRGRSISGISLIF